MPYIPFTEEQKLRANNVNLVEFLRRQGEKLIPSGRDKRLSSDHSITVRGNEWYDHESKEGGHAISFVQTYYGLTYPEAVKRLLDGEGVGYPQTVPSEPEKPKEFVLPPASPTMRQLYAYLLQQRFIDRDVLDAFTKRGMIYESCEKSRAGTKEYHNAVFVGSDEYGAARHAHKRSLYTQGNSFRRNVEGGDPYRMRIYGVDGAPVLDQTFNFQYSGVNIDGDLILLYNDSGCQVFNLNGVQKFTGSFDFTVSKVSAGRFPGTLLVTGPQMMKEIRLQ